MHQPPSSGYCESLLEASKIVPGIPTVPVTSKIPVSSAPFAPNPASQAVATANRPHRPEGLAVPTIRGENVGCQPMSGETPLVADRLTAAVQHAASLSQKGSSSNLSFGAATTRLNAPKPQQPTIFCDQHPERKQMKDQIKTADQNSSSISGSNKDNESVARNTEVVPAQQKTQSPPFERYNQKTGSTARSHNLRRRQAIDYSTAMGPTNKKQRSPYKRKLDDSTGTRLQLTEDMSLPDLCKEIHSKLGKSIYLGPMAAKFLLDILSHIKKISSST